MDIDQGVTLEYAKRCADAANAVVAFSIVQMLAFMFALGREDAIQKGVRANRCAVELGICLGTLAYVAIIIFLTVLELGLLGRRIYPSTLISLGVLRSAVAIMAGFAGFAVVRWFR